MKRNYLRIFGLSVLLLLCSLSLGFAQTITAALRYCAIDFEGPVSSLFVNYQDDGTGDYHLVSTSAAVGAGTSAACAPKGTDGCVATQDADGFVRPQGSSSDIGAYAYH
jgi:hypothetical protein